jgi:hypothetical protein
MNMTFKSVLLSCLLLCACSHAKPPQSQTSAPAQAPTTTAETGSATSCTRDDECYCRVFDGAEFHEGREASTCCTQEAGCPDAMGAIVAANHCMTCVYD